MKLNFDSYYFMAAIVTLLLVYLDFFELEKKK